MGNFCQGEIRPPPKTITYLPNSLPSEFKYELVDKKSIRFSEVGVRKSERNLYHFSMCIEDEVDIHAQIPVLNEIVHCITCENYQLDLKSRCIVDIFKRSYTNALFEVENKRTNRLFSMKVVPFKSYTTSTFKEAFYQLWINQKLGLLSNRTLKLIDYFIYGMNSEMQAFVFLFERTSTSLLNVSEYRREAGVPWSDKEKIKVFGEILHSYESLHEKNIVHRDLRPSNIYLCSSTGKFCIGNFSKSRLMRRKQEDDLMSVCGVPYYSCPAVEALMENKQQIGYYDGVEQDYYGLKSILQMLETGDIFDKNPHNPNKWISHLLNKLERKCELKEIIGDLKKIVDQESIDCDAEIGDMEISKSCSYLLAHTHKDSIQKWNFQTYGLLGYNKQYSAKAHRMLEINNEKDRELDNAPILTKLGQFYESKGSSGTEYFYNAFVLYLRRSEKQLKYGYPDKSQDQLDCAKQSYLKFNTSLESELPRIEIGMMNAILENERGNNRQAKTMIQQAFLKAAQDNIPIEKQCKVLLNYGIIYKEKAENRDEALKKLATGLTICQNSTSFQSPSSCRIFKSNFLYEMGSLYLNEMLEKHDPKKHSDSQIYGRQLKGKSESHLKAALQIREKEVVDDIDVAQCLEKLAYLYYYDEKFHDSKKYYERARIRLNHFKDEVVPTKQAMLLYMKGSCSYYLNEFQDAKNSYQSALRVLQKMENKKKPNILLGYNIQGNLGLTLIQMQDKQGLDILDSALSRIKDVQGERSYDYVCLKVAYSKISQLQ